MQKAIALTDFNSFPTQKKYALLEDFATYLGVYRLQGNYKIALFELSGYYVEVWLNQVTDKLWKTEAFDQYERLDPFIVSIDLSSIYCYL